MHQKPNETLREQRQMATKESKRQVKELLAGLESRLHQGPPLQAAELDSLQNYLRQNGFSPASDYFQRLQELKNRLQGRGADRTPGPAKRNYGGAAAGYLMQVQSVYDHLILSTCYSGEFNGRRGRIKLSHRFNQEGRIDFVELKYLRSMLPALDGELRKLLLVNGYANLRKDWLQAPASVLRVLPQELVFLYPEVFHCDRMELFAWLINIGHGLLADLLEELAAAPAGSPGRKPAAVAALAEAGRPGLGSSLEESRNLGVASTEPWSAHAAGQLGQTAPSAYPGAPSGNPGCGQLDLAALIHDPVALPILQKAAGLTTVVESLGPTEVLVRYLHRGAV